MEMHERASNFRRLQVDQQAVEARLLGQGHFELASTRRFRRKGLGLQAFGGRHGQIHQGHLR